MLIKLPTRNSLKSVDMKINNIIFSLDFLYLLYIYMSMVHISGKYAVLGLF